MNRPTIEQLMDLLEDGGYFYTRDESSSSELRFSASGDEYGPRGWGWRLIDIGTYQSFTQESATELFNDKQLNFQHIEMEMLNTIGMSAAIHNIKLNRINDILGKEFTEKATESMESFGNNLVNAVTKLINKSKLKVVEGNQ